MLVGCNIFWVARVIFPYGACLDGERAGPLANMLFGARHVGRHRM